MFTTLLPTLVLGMLLQDAAPVAETPRSDAKAEALMQEFESKLYSPVDDGLETLAFDITIPGPMGGGSMGVVSVNWKAEGGATVAFQIADEMMAMVPEEQRPQMQAMMKNQLEAPMQDMGEQLAAIQTNSMMAIILSKMTVKLVGAEDGFIKIVATPRPGTKAFRDEQVLLFDEDGMLQKTHERVQQMGQTIEQDQVMSWETVGDGLCLAGTESTSMMGTQSTRFVREKVAGFYLVTSMALESAGQEQVIAMDNFVVNGEAVGAEASPSTEGEG